MLIDCYNSEKFLIDEIKLSKVISNLNNIIIDNGSGSIKVGFSEGENVNCIEFPTIVGKVRGERQSSLLEGSQQKDIYIGSEA